MTAGSVDEAAVSITDNDVPDVKVSFGAAAYTATEGGTTTVTVELDEEPEREVTIPLTSTNENGASDADYSGVPASVTFSASQTSRTFTFTATDDADDDDGESVQLAFGTFPAGVTAGTIDAATVSIEAQQQAQTPLAPENLMATVNPDGTITLSWDAPDDDSITGYQILRRRPQEGEDTLLIYVQDTGNAAATFTDTEATSGTRHVYRVKAINSAGVGARSNYVNVDP